jgi:hypothetical protein
MLTVATVLKSGGIYDPLWVERLRRGVAQNLPGAHRFVCLSDVDVPCERIPLEHGWPGWWSKIELFRLPGPVLYFDLDTVIVGNLVDIATAAILADFVMLRDFYDSRHLQSSVMAWCGDKVAGIYEQFLPNPETLMAKQRARMGDQAYIEEWWGRTPVLKWQDGVPGQIVSYKVHCRNGGGIPEDARVICLHGYPKFLDMPANDPARQAWELTA